jgi:dipeptidyl aminopeptidase/acylaminoacyl peptidase
VIDEREHFERAIRGFPPPERSFERQVALRQKKRRKRRVAGGFVGFAIVLSGFLLAAEVMSDRPTSEPTDGSVRSSMSSAGIEIGTLASFGIPSEGTHDFRFSPDGSYVAFMQPDEQGIDQMFVMDTNGGGLRQITSQRPHGDVVWSPNGTSFTYISGFGRIYVVNLVSQTTLRVPFLARWKTGGAPNPCCVAWSPDGTRILYDITVGYADHVWVRQPVASIGSGTVGHFSGDHKSPFDSLWSPNGRSIARTVEGETFGSREIWVKTEGRGPRLIATVSNRDVRPMWSPDGRWLAYVDLVGGSYRTYVYDVSTGETTFLTVGRMDSWVDADTVLVTDG